MRVGLFIGSVITRLSRSRPRAGALVCGNTKLTTEVPCVLVDVDVNACVNACAFILPDRLLRVGGTLSRESPARSKPPPALTPPYNTPPTARSLRTKYGTSFSCSALEETRRLFVLTIRMRFVSQLLTRPLLLCSMYCSKVLRRQCSCSGNNSPWLMLE